METLADRFNRVKDDLFLFDTIYYMVLCSLKVEFTDAKSCGICYGDGTLYLSPSYFSDKSDAFLSDSVRIEIVRCMLRHPFRMRGMDKTDAYIASDMLIANNMHFREVKMKNSYEVFGTNEYNSECFEKLYELIHRKSDDDNFDETFFSGNGFCPDRNEAEMRSSMWTDDAVKSSEMDNLVKRISEGDSWGNIPLGIRRMVEMGDVPVFDFRRVMHAFRSSLSSPARLLTRMRPNRRFGCSPEAFGTTGSRRKEYAKLLVAVDSSGSVTDADFTRLLGIVKGVFRTDIESLWVVQWDTRVKEDTLMKIDRTPKKINRAGYGGTDVSCLFKWLNNSKIHYDGCLVFTDGCFGAPSVMPKNMYSATKYLFVINNAENFSRYEKNCNFMSEFNSTFLK